MSANNPATALYRILNSVTSSGAPTVGKGWKIALECDWQGADFARRHSAVVHLFHQVHTHLNSLPDEDEDKDLFLKYVPTWYRAVVFPEHWSSTSTPAANIIDQPSLDQLRGLGRVLHRTSGQELSGSAVSQLRESLRVWRELLGESGIPDDVAERIRGQVDLIDWLLANEMTFGSEPVIRESRTLVGMGVEVLAAVPAKAKKVAVALSYIVYMLTMLQQGVDVTSGILEGLNETVSQYEQLTDGTSSAPEAPAGELTDVVDAEVVETGELEPPGR